MTKNVLIGIVIAIVVFIILSQIMVWFLTLNLNTQKESKEEVLMSKLQSSPKALVIYQPGMTDASSIVAHQIAKGLNDEGYEVTLNYPGDYLSADVSKYSFLIFGSPVYSERPSKALIDYISRINASPSNKIVLYTTGGFKYYMGLDAMEKSLNGTKAYKKIKFLTSNKKEKDTIAYNLGKELPKE